MAGMAGPGQPTEVLCLLNMVVEEELVDEVCCHFIRSRSSNQLNYTAMTLLLIAGGIWGHPGRHQGGVRQVWWGQVHRDPEACARSWSPGYCLLPPDLNIYLNFLMFFFRLWQGVHWVCQQQRLPGGSTQPHRKEVLKQSRCHQVSHNFSPRLSFFLSSSFFSYYNPEKYHRREFWAARRRSSRCGGGVWFHFQLLHNTVRDWN